MRGGGSNPNVLYFRHKIHFYKHLFQTGADLNSKKVQS